MAATTTSNGFEEVTVNRSISTLLIILAPLPSQGSLPKSVRPSSQLAIQEFARPTVGKVSRGGVVVFSVMTGECMTLPRIAVHRRIRLLSKRRPNHRLRSFGDELILLGQMHENGRMKPIDLSQIFIGIGAVIPGCATETL